jgi:hypothetical protein
VKGADRSKPTSESTWPLRWVRGCDGPLTIYIPFQIHSHRPIQIHYAHLTLVMVNVLQEKVANNPKFCTEVSFEEGYKRPAHHPRDYHPRQLQQADVVVASVPPHRIAMTMHCICVARYLL